MYERKIFDLLNSVGVTISDFNFDTYNSQVRKAINDSKFILPDKKDPFLAMHPSVPKLYGLIKTHWPGLPIRSVVTSYCHPAFALSKFLATFFVALSSFVSSHSIKNSTKLVVVLSVLEFSPSTSLNYFGVTNMYSNIPVRFTIKLMCDLVTSNGVPYPTVLEFRKLINICVRYNFCGFLNRIYMFKDGLPMGGFLSTFMADVFMDHLEVEVPRSAPDA